MEQHINTGATSLEAFTEQALDVLKGGQATEVDVSLIRQGMRKFFTKVAKEPQSSSILGLLLEGRITTNDLLMRMAYKGFEAISVNTVEGWSYFISSFIFNAKPALMFGEMADQLRQLSKTVPETEFLQTIFPLDMKDKMSAFTGMIQYFAKSNRQVAFKIQPFVSLALSNKTIQEKLGLSDKDANVLIDSLI